MSLQIFRQEDLPVQMRTRLAFNEVLTLPTQIKYELKALPNMSKEKYFSL